MSEFCVKLINWISNDIFRTILISVLGGMSGYYSPRLLRKLKYRLRPVLIYQLDDFGNGQRRRIHHPFGERVDDKDAKNGKAWEHTNNRINEGEATCYGPYTKELALRGTYKARFRIKVCGIKDRESTIVTIDVFHGNIGPEGSPQALGLPIAEKELKGKKFKEGKYKKFDRDFEYDGQSFVEFRCLVNDPQGYKRNAEKILFDKVKIFQVINVF